jgi:hypothetical protein
LAINLYRPYCKLHYITKFTIFQVLIVVYPRFLTHSKTVMGYRSIVDYFWFFWYNIPYQNPLWSKGM